jgi:hypothetical protein
MKSNKTNQNGIHIAPPLNPPGKNFTFKWEVSGTVNVDVEARNLKQAKDKMNAWTRNLCLYCGDDGEVIGDLNFFDSGDITLFDVKGNKIEW